MNKKYKPQTLAQKISLLRSWEQKFYDYHGEPLHWFQVVVMLQGSIAKNIFPWIAFFGAYGFFISLLYAHRIHISFPKTSGITNIVLSFNLVLSLLLIFRTNSANERFWEARKLWGTLTNTVRNLSRGIWMVIEQEPTNKGEKEATLRLVVAFAIAMKLHLRREAANEELIVLMSSFQYCKLQDANHPPLEIAYWIEDYLQRQYECDRVNVDQLIRLQNLVDELVNILGDCERILKTPMPLGYAIYLKQLLITYCLILPIELVSGLNWWTGLVMACISFVFFGIEELGCELENPFGHDLNDLPLDLFCKAMLDNIENLIVTAPSRRFM